FLVLLYLFLIRVFSSLQRSLATENAVAARPIGIAHLVVQRTVRGAHRVGDRLPLRAVNALGRDAGNDIVINDEAASARHALVEFAEGEWWVEDTGSTNGTVVRSEEHTSELQSRGHLVCRLLLEKKKRTTTR